MEKKEVKKTLVERIDYLEDQRDKMAQALYDANMMLVEALNEIETLRNEIRISGLGWP